MTEVLRSFPETRQSSTFDYRQSIQLTMRSLNIQRNKLNSYNLKPPRKRRIYSIIVTFASYRRGLWDCDFCRV